MREDNAAFAEELCAYVFHPKRVAKWLEQEYDCEDWKQSIIYFHTLNIYFNKIEYLINLQNSYHRLIFIKLIL